MYAYGMYVYGMYAYGMYTYGIFETIFFEDFLKILLTYNLSTNASFRIGVPSILFIVTNRLFSINETRILVSSSPR